MGEWTDVTLGEVLTLQRGFDLPQRKRRPGPYPVVSSAGFTGLHDEFKVSPPGVVIGRYGSLGTVHWVQEPFWPLNTALWVKDFKGNDPRFISYLLETVTVDGSAAAAVPGVNRNHLHKQCVRVPTMCLQRRIVALLSTLDELIKINERRIELLEDLTRSLYREWFVHFRVPGDIHARAHGSEGDDVFEGWSELALGDLCSLLKSGGTPSRSDLSNWVMGTRPWFKTGELRDGPLFDSVEHVTDRAGMRVFDPPAIFMAIYGSPTVGRLGWITRASSCNQAALALRAGKPHLEQDWLWYELLSLRGHFNAMAQGAAQQNISRQKVAETLVKRPPDHLLAAFAEAVGPVRALWVELAAACHRLSQTRDLLLPRLVTGQLDISDIDLGVLTPTDSA